MSPEQERLAAGQWEVARLALSQLDGFALAGSGAIREHGVIDRPTADVDLFTTNVDVRAFNAAVDLVIDGLEVAGGEVVQTRFSDDELLAAATDRDTGFEVGMFAQQLAAVSRLQIAQVAPYGVDADQLEAVKARCAQWARDLRDPP